MNYIVVTNTYKRQLYLVERSLRASLKQIPAPSAVFLLDQNEVEVKLPADIADNSLFKHVRVLKNSVSAARNSIEIPAGTDWLFFCDDDGYFCDDYTERFFKILKDNPLLEIVAGSIVREDNNDYYSYRHKIGGSLKHFKNTKNLMGSNFAIRAKTFDELGRFDEKFGVGSYWGSGEETDFCWQAFFSKKEMEFFPELIVYHIPPFNESIRIGFKKAFRYGVGKGALVWKWLVVKRKPAVFYELAEMFAVPFVQAARGLLSFKFQLVINNVGIFAGRVFGLIKAAFVGKF